MKINIRQAVEEYISTLDYEHKEESYDTEQGCFLAYKEDLILFLEKEQSNELEALEVKLDQCSCVAELKAFIKEHLL